MRKFFIALLLIPLFLNSSWDDLFTENEDLSLFHHVDVISGQLNISFQDGIVQGAVPFPIIRTYTSGGILEKLNDKWYRKICKGLILQEGWNFLPHINLLFTMNSLGGQYTHNKKHVDKGNLKAYLPEVSGHMIAYEYETCSEKNNIVHLKPAHDHGQYSGNISGRNNPYNNRLRVDFKKGVAILLMPNGGHRIYKGHQLENYTDKNSDRVFPRKHYYHLQEEKLPSQ